jgi:hypothetical protein
VELNEFGPLQTLPLAELLVRFIALPTQIGELLPAIGLGFALTNTSVVAVAEQPFASVTVKV